jgi:predicted dehydrogenase
MMLAGKLRVGVVGAGKMGSYHARIWSRIPHVELVGIADANPSRARELCAELGVRGHVDYRELGDQLDGVSVAVPPDAHDAVAGFFIERRIPTLVEKPLAMTAQQGRRLVALASERKTLLHVGHIERYNPAFCSFAESPFCREINHILAIRCARYDDRSKNVGVVLDLMIHDIDLALSLIPGSIQDISASGREIQGSREDEALARLVLSNGCIVDLFASRHRLTVGRIMRVSSSEGTAHLDFVKRSTSYHPIRRCQKPKLSGNQEVSQSDGRSPLEDELREFVDAIEFGSQPRVTALDALQALELAERITAQAMRRGAILPQHAAPPFCAG